MIVDVVQFPTAYAIDTTASVEAQMDQADRLIHLLLYELTSQGVLVMDADTNDPYARRSRLRREIEQTYQSWPDALDEYKRAARSLLGELDKRNRIMGMASGEIRSGSWPEPFCELALQVSRQSHPKGVLAPTLCRCGRNCLSPQHTANLPIVPRHRFALSPLPSLLTRNSLTIPKGVPAQGRLNAELWQPLFRWTDRAAVYDRYLGRNAFDLLLEMADHELQLVQDYGAKRQSGAPARLDIPSSNRQKKSWTEVSRAAEEIANSFTAFSTRAQRTITFCFELRSSTGRFSQTAKIATAYFLWDWANSLTRKLSTDPNNPVTVALKMIEPLTKNDSFDTHDRFIVTEQIALGLGRGIELTDQQGISNGITVSIIDDSEFPERPFLDQSKWITRGKVR